MHLLEFERTRVSKLAPRIFEGAGAGILQFTPTHSYSLGSFGEVATAQLCYPSQPTAWGHETSAVGKGRHTK
jgi:hypothetical protein